MADLCKCGCGGEIIIKPWHKWRGIPSYLHGHGKGSTGRKCSEETRRRISDSKKGTPCWNAGKTGIYSDETLKKIKDARARQVMEKGRKYSDESKEKNRVAHLGKVHSDESKKKVSEKLKGQIRTEEQKIKYSKSKIGEKNPRWLGGITKLPYSQDWTEDLKDAIRKRDNFSCQLCGVHQDKFSEKVNRKLTVHHIDYDKKNCNPDNLTTLCISCHTKTGHNRESWKLFFTTFQEAQNSNAAILAN